MTFDELFRIIKERKKRFPQNSYVSSLLKEGKDRIIQKVGEEAVELIMAAKGGKKKEIIDETADLWFHTLVLLAFFDIKPEKILNELEKRRQENS